MDGGVVVELGDQRQQRRFGRSAARRYSKESMPASFVVLRLVAHIDLARRILADQHHGEAGHDARRRAQGPDLGRDLGQNAGRESAAVDDLRHRHKASIP